MKAVIFSLAMSMMVPTAHAGVADTYVKGLKGNWRGSGTVRVNEKGKKVRLRCSSRNTLNAGSRTLTMRGKCASSQGTRPLRGTIRYSADGKSITSANLRLGKEGGSVSARFRGKTLMLFGAAKTKSGKRVKTRSSIRGGGNRFTISLSANLGKGYRPIGRLVFSR